MKSGEQGDEDLVVSEDRLPPESSTGGPARRAPRFRGALTAPLGRLPSSLSGFGKYWSAPELRVWSAPALRGLAFTLGLGLVALLGREAEGRQRDGRPALAASALDARVSLPPPGRELDPGGAPPSPSGLPSGLTPHGPAPVASSAGPPCVAEKADRRSALTADGKIILNEATAEELTRLPGVGAKRAEALLALRQKLGKFKRMSDLLRVRGVGAKSLKKFAEVAVLDRPEDPPAPAVPAEPEAREAGGRPPDPQRNPATRASP